MGGSLATLIVGRDSGYQPVAPPCPQCGQPMRFEGYRPWTVKGLEGDSILEWADYTCPAEKARISQSAGLRLLAPPQASGLCYACIGSGVGGAGDS